jgi:hypothetical protein
LVHVGGKEPPPPAPHWKYSTESGLRGRGTG